MIAIVTGSNVYVHESSWDCNRIEPKIAYMFPTVNTSKKSGIEIVK